MKYFVTFLFIALLCQNLTEAQTPSYAGLPGPENVLVVYKAPVDSSRFFRCNLPEPKYIFEFCDSGYV